MKGSKIGVQPRHAKLAMAKLKKLDDDEACLLQAHLRKATAAQNLNPHNIFDLTPKELHINLTELGNEPLLTSLMLNLLDVHAKKHMQTIIATDGREGVGQLLEVLRPLSGGDFSEKRFDPFAPVLADIPDKATMKAKEFSTKVMTLCINPLVKEGTKSEDILQIVTTRLLEMLDAVGLGEQPEEVAQPIECVGSIARALCALLSPTMQVLAEAASDLCYLYTFVQGGGGGDEDAHLGVDVEGP